MAELFQSTPPQGGDTYDTYAKMKRYKFQSTPPQGGDLSGVRISLPHCYFNPHHRKVVTCLIQNGTEFISDFNPHHRKVVTVGMAIFADAKEISIHTTARW